MATRSTPDFSSARTTTSMPTPPTKLFLFAPTELENLARLEIGIHRCGLRRRGTRVDGLQCSRRSFDRVRLTAAKPVRSCADRWRPAARRISVPRAQRRRCLHHQPNYFCSPRRNWKTWRDSKLGSTDAAFAEEERELTVYNVPGGHLIEFASRLRSPSGRVQIDGDPQHAGFQFRAHNDVDAYTTNQTIFVRPDGIGKPGETRNWDPETGQGPVNLPGAAITF